MRATFKLLNSYFWKTIYGPVLSFLIPFVLLAILGNIFKVEYIYPGIIALSFLFIGLLALPLAIMELKRSALFKYIGTSPVNPMRFTIVAIFYFIFIAICSSIIIFISTMALFSKEVFVNGGVRNGVIGGIYSTVAGFFSFFISAGMHLLFVIVSGLIISTFSKTPQQALTIGICIIIPSMFLSGMILSVDIIAQSRVLNWISRFIPYRYSTGNMVIASTPLNQLGDMFTRMPINQKILIFPPENVVGLTQSEIGTSIPDSLTGNKIVLKEGYVKIYDSAGLTTSKIYIAKSMEDLIAIRNKLTDINFQLNIKDKKLYELVLKKAMDIGLNNSDNNIFQWKHEWSVQRIPQIESVRDFITEYFKKFRGSNASFSDLQPFAEQIAKGEFEWLNIFLKQSNTLYFKADRVLNLLLPLSLSIYGIAYVVKYFKWSVR